jgi:hypothetical protein
MTRRLTPHAPRRQLRARAPLGRHEHGLDVAAPERLDDAPADRGGSGDGDARALRALAAENAMLARELGRVQQRCTRWRDDCIAQADRLERQLMLARAECLVKETQMASLRDALEALHQRAATWLTNEELVRRLGDLRARTRSLENELAESRRAVEAMREARVEVRAAPASLPAPAPAATTRGPSRVLCVGGRARQIPVYRELVERGGGRFAHVDGSADGCLAQLSAALAEADVVILQAGFASQRACHAVETHCRRTGTRCVWLDKPCVPGFARSLATALQASTPP